MLAMWKEWAEKELPRRPGDKEFAYLLGNTRSIEPMAKEEECKMEHNGYCIALACYQDKNCKARKEKIELLY